MKMIKLKNGYGIISDGKSFTLVQNAIQVSKDGVKTEIKKQISFHYQVRYKAIQIALWQIWLATLIWI